MLNTPSHYHKLDAPDEEEEEDEGELSPMLPRIKIKRLPKPTIEFVEPQSHTFTTKAKNTMIQNFSDSNQMIEVLPIPQKKRKGTDGSTVS